MSESTLQRQKRIQERDQLRSELSTKLRTRLRTKLRKKRRALPASTQSQNAKSLARVLLSLPQIQTAKHIGVYLSFDGEISLAPLIKELWTLGINCYLPVVQSEINTLLFSSYTASHKMSKNCYSIDEPISYDEGYFDIKKLDILLMPLVGFDCNNNRLGMGGGFYDRSLASIINQSKKDNRPELIGVAHSIQQVDTVPSEYWDIRPDSIATEKSI